MKTIFFVGFVILFPLTLLSQEADTSMVSQEADTSMAKYRKDALKVFLDCPFCDDDYIRREISFVNYVRDRKVADVHIMVTYQRTGSGGEEYTFHFLGQNEFDGQNDTLKYSSITDDTREIIRKGQTDVLKLGLMRYVAKTPLAKHINIQYEQPTKEELVEDKWKSWVFETRVSSYMNAQESVKWYYFSGSFSASKVTPDWKLEFDMDYDIDFEKYVIGEDTVESKILDKSFDGLIVKSLGEHWSIGGMADILSYSYSNYKLKYSVYPAIEYDLFPYSESTRKQLRILYGVGYTFHQYEDSTIYNKIKENLFGHRLSVALQVTQKWGSIYTYINWSNYFHDWGKNKLSLSTSLSFRIAKGLELRIGGSASRIHDQLSLMKGEATAEQILLRIRELETSYRFFTNFSISYTFGSIYSNVVNPRFGGGGGMMFYY